MKRVGSCGWEEAGREVGEVVISGPRGGMKGVDGGGIEVEW